MKFLANLAVWGTIVALSTAARAADASSLKPPPGAKVAVVVFEDLECPDCARLYPIVVEVAGAHHVPVVLHDFPLPRHPWAFDAAAYARYFDTKSEKTGNDFRGYIYRNQPQITRENLRQYVQKFADDNKVPLPFVIDPEGKLKAKIKADYDLGQQIGIEHTPTIFVIGRGGAAAPFVEVADRVQLSQSIEDMLKKTSSPATKPAQNKSKSKKKAA
ncbi:MAG TPA: thioredoxin domain-containing protein [Alphaproteobacteria bacterium]|nr:thioredoxin domain-containing protein [Alphaproteobacteria bacterium]